MAAMAIRQLITIMIKINSIIKILYFLFLIPSLAHSITWVRPITFVDSKIMMMGGSAVATANDSSALFMNPACLAELTRHDYPVYEKLRNPTLWSKKYKHMPIYKIFDIDVFISVNLLSEENQKAFQTLVNMGMFGSSPGTFNTLNDMLDKIQQPYNASYIQWLISLYSGFIKINKFKKEADGYPFSTTSELNKVTSALGELAGENISFAANIELLSLTFRGFSIGFFDKFSFNMRFDDAASILYMRAPIKIYNDLILAAGLGVHIPHDGKWCYGITLKFFLRQEAEYDNMTDFIASLNAHELSSMFPPGTRIPEGIPLAIARMLYGYMFKGETYPTISDNIRLGHGFGFDLGALYRHNSKLRVGFTFTDVFTGVWWWDRRPGRYAIPINLKAGIVYCIPKDIWKIFENIKISFDLTDIFYREKQGKNYWANFLLNTHIGFSTKFLFKIFNIRAGFNGGAPSIGVGTDIGAAALGGAAAYFLSRRYVLKKNYSSEKNSNIVLGWTVAGACIGLTTLLLEYLPVLRIIKPDNMQPPVYNPNRRNFKTRNWLLYIFTLITRPVTYMHTNFEISYIQRELGTFPGHITDSQVVIKISAVYTF